MDISLYIKEESNVRMLKVPLYIVRDLLRDRLSNSELKRINRFAEKTTLPNIFKPKSIVIDFQNKTARCFSTGLNIETLEPTWNVKNEEVTLMNY